MVDTGDQADRLVRQIRARMDYVGIDRLPQYFRRVAAILREEMGVTAVAVWENCVFGSQLILRAYNGVGSEEAKIGMTIPRRASLTGRAIRSMDVQEFSGPLAETAARFGCNDKLFPWTGGWQGLATIPIGSHYNPHQILYAVNLLWEKDGVQPGALDCFGAAGLRETLGLAFDYVLYKADESIAEGVLDAWAGASVCADFFRGLADVISERVHCSSLRLYKVGHSDELELEASWSPRQPAFADVDPEDQRDVHEHCVRRKTHRATWELAPDGQERCVDLSVPIPGEGQKVLGVLRCSTDADRPSLTSSDLHVLYSYASAMASPFSRMLEQRKSRLMEKLLTNISQIIVSSEGLDEILSGSTAAIRELLGASRCSVYLLDAEAEVLRIAGMSGFPDDERLQQAHYALGEGVTGAVFSERQPLVFRSYEAIRSHPSYAGKYDDQIWPKDEKPQAFAGVPLISGDEAIGVLKVADVKGTLDHPEAYFTEDDVRGLRSVAALLAGAVSDYRSKEAVAAIEYRKLSRGAITIHSAQSVQDAIRYALDALADSGFEEAMVSLLDDKGQAICGAQARGERWDKIKAATVVPVGDPDILAHVMSTERAEFVADSRSHERCHRERVEAAGLVSQYVMPLVLGEEKIGTMQVAIEPPTERLDKEKEVALDAFAQHLISSIVRIRQSVRLLEMSDVVLGSARFLIAETLAAQTVHSLGHQLNQLIGDAKKLLRNKDYRGRPEIKKTLEGWIATFEEILTDARRTLDQLRAPKSTDIKVIDVHVTIQKAIDRWITAANSHDARFESPKLQAEFHRTRLPAYSLIEILSVLIVNALQAKARMITIHTESVNGYVLDDEEYLPYAVFVYVSDNGNGLASDAKGNPEKIFEPTYSTKASGVGTGLGLFIARSIARSGGGDLFYEGTTAGPRGARFRLVLPAVNAG